MVLWLSQNEEEIGLLVLEETQSRTAEGGLIFVKRVQILAELRLLSHHERGEENVPKILNDSVVIFEEVSECKIGVYFDLLVRVQIFVVDHNAALMNVLGFKIV